MTPGYKTTEFWAVIITNVISIAVVTGVFTQEQGGEMTKALILLAGVLVPMITTTGYVKARTTLKSLERWTTLPYVKAKCKGK